MGLQLLYVIKHKNEYEKLERKRRKQELDELKQDGLFRVALNKELSIIRTILDDDSIKYVDVEINDKYLINFHGALNFEEISEFRIRQGRDATKFRFERKEIDI